MTAFNHLMPGREHREALRNAIQYKMYEDIDHILLEIEKVCQCSTVKVITDKKSTIDQDELKFWLVDVGRLMFDERSTNTRRLALNALDAAASYIVTTNYQEHSKWPELRGILSKEYTCLLDTARSEKDPNWHRVWSVLVRIVNRDLCQGSSIINMFLSIVEAGFRSPELSIREQSFDCWRLLVEIFAKNKQINILKRVKLICIPLKSSKSKTEAIALKKFDIWWFLLCHLRSQLTSMVDTIFEPFIYFCFGPTFKTPLCYYFDESYQEYGAPGKMYQSIKQLSAIALIHLLGTVPDICKTLLNCPNNTDSKLPFSFETFSSENGLCISSLLFSMKSKLIIDSCIECTVLFAEMKHLDYLSLNRCLWNNLIDRIIEEKTIPKHEMLQWIKEDMDSLLKLCIRQKHDLPLRELLYDTILKIAESDLIVVNIGHDSPDQLTFNYKMIMSLIIHPQLSCPASKTDQIIKRVFDLKRYIKNNNYWDMLKKTIQYMCYSNDENETNGYKFQTLNTQIYCLLGEQLIERIRVDVSSSEENQQTVINFLLYPLEYDHFLVIDTVKNMWINAYESILNNDKASCKFSNTFCEAIKAMTVAKYAYNLEVVADFFCIIFKTIPEKFDHSCPPIKILELFKDLTRKGFAYQSNFDRIQIMVCSFRKLLKKMNLTNVLTLILPIRNVINELISNVHGLAMTEVKETLHVLTKKITLNLSKELTEQPNEVKFNCKMLLTSLLDLPMSVKQEFKINDIKRCINICDYNSINKKTPTRNADKEDFVVINSVWKFKPESLTEHQREKMMEKRTDIPALYNDMSQSQDSFIIKPWAPNKNAILQKDLTNTSDKITPGTHVTASDIEKNSSDHIKVSEPVVLVCETEITSMEIENESKSIPTPSDKENNSGNVLSDEYLKVTIVKELSDSADDDGPEKTKGTHTKKKFRKMLDQLRIDTVEGKSFNVMNLSDARTTRLKSGSKRIIESEKKQPNVTNNGEKSFSDSKAIFKRVNQKDKRSSRKLLKFDNIESTSLCAQENSHVSNDIIESSQTSKPAQLIVNKKSSLRKSKIEDSTDTTTAGNLLESTHEMNNAYDTREVSITTVELGENMDVNEINTSLIMAAIDHQSLTLEKIDTDHCTKVVSDEEKKANALQNAKSSQSLYGSPNKNEELQKLDILLKRSPRKVELTLENTILRSPSVCMSPSRRTGLSTIDLAAVTNKMVSPLSKKYLEDKMLIKCLLSPSKSPKKNEMGSSSQRTNVGVINEQRDCMSPKRNTSKGVHSSMFENQTGLTSPKVVRFSPVVVVEPITKLELFADTGINPNSHPVSSAMVSKENDEAHIRKNDEVFQLAANDLPESDIDQLSPAKNLDEQMKPLNKSPNRSIVSSPDRADVEERNADLLNNTLNISPISEEKNCSRTYTDDNGVPSSTDKKSSLRKITKEKESTDSPVQMSTNHRRTKASPNLETSDRSNTGSMKSRPLQQSPALAKTRSPSTTMIGLGGRGAQLINLIRNQHGDQSYRPNTPPQNASTPKGSILSEATSISMRKKAIAASVGSIEVNEISETTNENEEKYENVPPQYLVFSKVLPSPQASPASSILKRRHNLDDSVDDIETPVHKRKRVSFHDPPVSLTKEYIRQVEECRTSSVSRNIQLSSNIASSTDKTKFMMRRRSKSDSISELQNFTQKQTTTEINKTANLSCLQDVGRSGNKNDERSISPESLDESNFMMNDRTDNMSTLQVTTECMETEADKSESYKAKSVASKTNIQADSEDTFEQNTKDTEKVHGSFKELSFTCEEAVFEYVMKNYTLDDIVERYISAGKSLEKNKTVRVLTKELSSKMSDDPKMREIVLDELSERHSVEFLDHAIQENSNAKVCERLSLTVMIDHIFKQLHTSHGTHTNKGLVATLDEKEEDATKIVEYIYEKLFNLRNIELDGQTFDELRDRFVRHELANKTRLEIMSLLEEYFKTSNEEQC